MTTQYSLAEIKNHNDNKSTWIVIHNNVYDVTQYLNEHPGGEEVLLEEAGKEASEAFEDVGHSSDAKELMMKYKIGELVESERILVKKKNTDSKISFTAWIIIPISLGILTTLLYRFHFRSS